MNELDYVDYERGSQRRSPAVYHWDPDYGEPFYGHVLAWENHLWETQRDREMLDFDWMRQEAHVYQWADEND